MDKTAKVVGKLADRIRINPNDGKLEGGLSSNGMLREDQVISGVLVQNDLQLSLMDADDLREYAGLTTTVITCRQKITLAAAGIELIRWALEGTFGGIVDVSANTKNEGLATNGDGNGALQRIKKEEEQDNQADEEIDRSTYRFLIMDTVTLTYRNQGEIEIEWEGNMINDGIADAVMSVLLTVESSPAAVKRESCGISYANLVASFSLLAIDCISIANTPHRIKQAPLSPSFSFQRQQQQWQWQQ